jgi:hypothetical protein
MIERKGFALNADLRIEVANWDGQTEIPGYSAEIFDAGKRLAFLTKKPKSTALRTVAVIVLGSVAAALTTYGADK